jgi:uncharacterized protein YqgC (DUF456 family)
VLGQKEDGTGDSLNRESLNRHLLSRFTIHGSRFTNPMELFWWLFTIVVFAVGLIGTVLPVFPGTTIILAAAVIHRMMLGPEKSIGWKSIALLVLLTLASYAFDFLGSYFGARYFGATRWAAFGAVVGAVVGIFFGIMGLFVGPVIGAVAGEFIAGKRMIDAGRAGWGSLLGNLGAMVGKLLIGLVMIAVFLVSAPSPF